ncbi:DNA/RNA non-specific endonuclease [Ekhidna sp.]|uniref:DNA/RNA non-specific endonuclease n=1 Tax=Ekhidna sp. TaxID=2608089 RepID=UPI003BABBA37
MSDYATIQKECKFGIPAADQIVFNRYYTVGYSYFLRQPKWVLEIVDPLKIHEFEEEHVERQDTFRPDFRIPMRFRADLIDFKKSGYDRGHLVPNADQSQLGVQNSETFLLTNMTPQTGGLNRYKWRYLEEAVRKLDMQPHIHETYVMTGPIIDLSKPTKFIGVDRDRKKELKEEYNDVDVTIPVPHKFFKSILIENDKGKHYMWNFIMENKKEEKALKEYQVTTKKVELLAGIKLWPNLMGDWIEWEKTNIRNFWDD